MKYPRIQRSQVVFGDTVYWITVVVAIICMVGPVIAFASMDGNVLNPHYLFTSMWAGMGPEAIWESAGEMQTGLKHLVSNIASGDGFTQLGLAIGISIPIPAMLAAAAVYAFKERSPGWALSALWIVGLVTVSVLGIISV